MDNLNTKATGLALGITSAIIYIICAATYWIWPNLVINYSNYLFHGVDITAITNKAITFGNDAKKNVKTILESGFKSPEDNGPSNETVMQIIIVLAIVLVWIFLFEKFYINKKRKEPEEYDKYE